MRLAYLYALLDGSDVVKVAHLASALQLWGYAERAANYIWCGKLGDRWLITRFRPAWSRLATIGTWSTDGQLLTRMINQK